MARESIIPLEPLNREEAGEALRVFKALRVPDLPGKPTFGEVCAPWVFDFVAAIFGACDPDTGAQMVSEFFLCISKKNAKSTIAAGIMLTALILNWRENEELLIIAPTVEIAKNSYEPAAAMVRADEDLMALLHIQDHLRTITHRTTKAALKVVAADTDTVGGKKAGRILIDELWIFGKRPAADAMLREATGGMVSRPEGFVIYLTTQSDAPPAGVFKAKLDYARDVRDGRITDRQFLPVIFEFPRAMIDSEAYLDPANFYVTNPNLGRSVSREWLERELGKEMAGDAGTRATFLAKHLNVEIGMNLRSNRWAGADFWQRRAEPMTLDDLLDRSEVVAVGIDGGGADDLLGLCVLGREIETRRWLAWFHAWCHEGVLDRRKSIASRLRDFQRAGDLTIVGDELDDIAGVVDVISAVKDRGLLAQVGVDPAQVGAIVDALAEIDVTPENGLVTGVSQGWSMMNQIKTAERKLINGTLVHDGSALGAWAVANLKIEPTATGIRATKANAGDAKIDPAMAMFDAVAIMAKNPEAVGAQMTPWDADPEYRMVM